MIRRLFRRLVKLGALVTVVAAVTRALRRPPAPAPAAGPSAWPPITPVDAPAWVEPDGDDCPATHPVKAKLASKIFHVPGGASYDRTKPDRCYRDAAAAEADGLRPAKR